MHMSILLYCFDQVHKSTLRLVWWNNPGTLVFTHYTSARRRYSPNEGWMCEAREFNQKRHRDGLKKTTILLYLQKHLHRLRPWSHSFQFIKKSKNIFKNFVPMFRLRTKFSRIDFLNHFFHIYLYGIAQVSAYFKEQDSVQITYFFWYFF